MAKKNENLIDDILNDILNDKEIQKMNRTEDMIVKGANEIDEGDIEPLVTPFPSLNLSIGIGGIPKGKIVEISGEEGSFKSALCWCLAGEVQRSGGKSGVENGGVVAWIDAENAVDLRIPKVRKFLDRLRVNYKDIIIIRPGVAENAFQICKILAKRGDVDLIIFDSIVALSNQREEKGGIEKEDRNTLPQTINKGLRQCAPLLRKTDTTLILINQLRVNLDAKTPYDKKWQTNGGKGLKHWCSLRLYAWKRKIKNSDKEHIGNEVTYSVEKTRFDNPRDNAKLFYYFASGFNIEEEILNLAIEWGILEKRGNSYEYIIVDEDTGEVLEEYKYTRNKWLSILSEEENKELLDGILEDVRIAYEEYYSDDEEQSVAEDSEVEDEEEYDEDEYEEEEDEDE